MPADRRHYWAGRLRAKGSDDSTRYVSELMDEIGVPSGVDGGRRGLTMARGRWVYVLECGADHEVTVKGEGARHVDAAVDFLTNYEAWVAGQAGARF
jgi:hypothetical protein